MKPRIDTLFRSKLEHYATPAPQRAWDRIEAGLNNTTHKKFWLKIAAGIALLASVTWLVVNHPPEAEQLAQQIPVAPKSPGSLPEDNAIPSLSPEIALPVTAPDKPLKQIKSISKSDTQQAHPVAVTESPTEETAFIATTLNQQESIAQPATGMVIVLTAEEVNAKYLVKTSAEEATPEQKKSSRLQKLAVLAHNLSNEDVLGDLRERKNELFAFNFRDNNEKKN